MCLGPAAAAGVVEARTLDQMPSAPMSTSPCTWEWQVAEDGVMYSTWCTSGVQARLAPHLLAAVEDGRDAPVFIGAVGGDARGGADVRRGATHHNLLHACSLGWSLVGGH